MFPYPSGAGLHVGHPEGLHRHRHRRALQAHARLQRAAPDGLGRLRPARRAVRDRDRHAPARDHRGATSTTFRRQLKRSASRYDWRREIDTTDPGYVRWTQWIFRKLYERGLAYVAEVPVNWCPALGTVLANEEVIDGKSERGGHPVVRVPMRQWMLRITAYADRLLDDLDALDWPERDQEDAAQLDRPLARARACASRVRRPPGRARSRSSRRGPTRSSAPPTWCSRPSTRSSTRITDAGAARRGARLRRGGGAPERARAHRPTRRARPASSTGAFAMQPGERRAHPDLDRRLRARRLRHRRDHGGARPRRARLRVRAARFGLPIVEVVRGRRRRARRPSPATAWP